MGAMEKCEVPCGYGALRVTRSAYPWFTTAPVHIWIVSAPTCVHLLRSAFFTTPQESTSDANKVGSTLFWP
uniref:Uncharacterized protein n=1 Tax=Steinernema glaseri TaxID=37863 RepID=A0A1I8AVR6_9BILA